MRIVINQPAAADPARPVQLIVYALPNGNTIEQTMGHLRAPGELRRRTSAYQEIPSFARRNSAGAVTAETNAPNIRSGDWIVRVKLSGT